MNPAKPIFALVDHPRQHPAREAGGRSKARGPLARVTAAQGGRDAALVPLGGVTTADAGFSTIAGHLTRKADFAPFNYTRLHAACKPEGRATALGALASVSTANPPPIFPKTLIYG